MKLKILFKKYGLLGLKDWYVDNNIVAVGSADKSAEGKHHCRSTRFHKQSFEALFRFRIMKISENLTLDDTFTALIGRLRIGPFQALVGYVIAHPNFSNIRSTITATSGTLSPIFVNYLKDVLVFLAMIMSVRECERDAIRSRKSFTAATFYIWSSKLHSLSDMSTCIIGSLQHIKPRILESL